MRRRRTRLAAWLMAAALALSLYPAAGRAVLSDVYFTAVNEQLLELNSETMPFWSGGVLYVPSRVFSETDLGVSFVRNGALAMLYTTHADLRFDLEQQLTYDKEGTEYTGHALERGGLVFFPLDMVCGCFGLKWSYTRTDTVPLIRITSSGAVLSAEAFIDAAGWQMRSAYNEYEKAVSTPPVTETPSYPNPVIPPLPGPENPPPIQAAEGQKVYLILSSASPEDTRAAMEALDGVQATFLLTVEQLEDGDLARGLAAGGHAVALCPTAADAAGVAEELAQARELLWQAACLWLDLIWCDGREDLRPLLAEWGCVPVEAGLDRREQGLRGAAAARTLLRSISRRQEDVAVYLGGDGSCLGGLEALTEGMLQGGYRVCAWRMA